MKILLDVLPGAEGDAAARSLGLRLPLQRGSALQGTPSETLVVWIHRAPDQAEDLRATTAAAVAALKSHIERGGRLLLTGPAVDLLEALGLEPELPRHRPDPLPEPGPRGVQPFLDHPLFRRFPGGVLLAETAEEGSAVGFGATVRPRNGVLTGVEKTLEGCVPEHGLLLEHRLGTGRVLSLLAPLRFAKEDAYAEHRLRFAGDLVDYLLSDGRAAAARPWPAGVAQVELVGGWPLPAAGPAPEAPSLPRPELTELRSAGGGWRGVASPAGLLWQEAQGRGEVWFRGTRILRDLRWRVITGAREVSLLDHGGAVAQAPGFLWQQVDAGGEGPACAVEPTATGLSFHWLQRDPAALLEIQGVLEHALEAPWPASSLAPLRVQRAPDGRGLLWQDGVLGRAALLRLPTAPTENEGSVCEGERESGYRFRVRLPLPADGPATVTLAAAESVAELTRPQTAKVAAAGLLRLSLMDPGRDQELAWSARNALEAALPLRSGERVLLGGFGVLPPALLGAEALWATEPLLWHGAREVVRSTLSCLARHQDASGRIPRQVLWSGIPQSDTFEPTLLFPVALGAWLDITGDVELLRSCWSALSRAVRLLEERDQDGDGVPELMDSDSSLLIRVDQLALLVHGLRAACRVAEALGERNAALQWSAWSEQLHSRLHSACFDAELGTYALGIGGQGVPVRMLTPLCAIPVALGLSDPAVACAALVAFEAPGQALASGVRHGAALADAQTSHARDTGLLALAEFRAGRPEHGQAWLQCLLRQVRDLAPAGIPRAVSAAPGASPDARARDTLGHALAVGAVLQGMLGVAAGAGLRLSPTLPAGQTEITFADLRFRGHVLAGAVCRGREEGELLITLRKADDAPLAVRLAPFFGRGREPHQVLAGEERLRFLVESAGEGWRAVVQVELVHDCAIRFCTTPVTVSEPVPPPPAMRFVGGPVPAVEPETATPEPPASPAGHEPPASGNGIPREPERDAGPDLPAAPLALDLVRVVSALGVAASARAFAAPLVAELPAPPAGDALTTDAPALDPVAAQPPVAVAQISDVALATAAVEANGTHAAPATAQPPGLPAEPAAPAIRPLAKPPVQRRAVSGAGAARTALPRPAGTAPRPAAGRTQAAPRRRRKGAPALVVLVVVACAGALGFAILEGLRLVEAEAREHEQRLEVPAAPPAVPETPEEAPTPALAPSAGVRSGDTLPEIAPVPPGIEALDLAALVELLGPPSSGEPPADGRCEFRLPGGGLLVGQVEAGGWSAARIVTPVPAR